MLHTTKNLFFILSVSFVISVTQTSFADEIPPPPLNAVPLPVGSGARALGQGGAFIAVADDATAASWNPGGLVQLERPELSVVGSLLSTQQDFDSGSTGFSLGNESVSRGDLNYASVVYPLKVFGKNLVAALNYQQIYDFHMQLDFKTGDMVDVDFESKGGVGALTPAISMRVTPKLSVGVAVNVFTDEFFGDYAWKAVVKNTEVDGDNAFGRYTYKNFQAVNVTTGLLWHVWEKEERRLTFGAVYDTPYTADVDLEYNFGSNIGSPFHQRGHFEIDYPMSFGVGLAFRSSDALSFSTDVTWTDWTEFEQKDEEGNRTRPLGYVTPADRDIDDTYAVRCGTEYLIFKQKFIIPVRGGLFYEPRPSLGDPTDVYGFSVGSGITFKRFSLDGAYQFRWANDVDGEDFGLDGTHFDLTEHMFLASVIVYF
ncbi:MAG: outer membrane protein transport protein [Candidatus Brocadia sp.]|nr:outer membrane protein transport protein [Candidatus Brocadia sp.]